MSNATKTKAVKPVTNQQALDDFRELIEEYSYELGEFEGFDLLERGINKIQMEIDELEDDHSDYDEYVKQHSLNGSQLGVR